MFADLHLHSNFSDGTYSPEEVAGHGRRLGFSALALTDHDSLEGCPRMAAACAAAGIEFVVGTELTAEHEGNELHILAYFVDPQNGPLLSNLARFQAVRQERVLEMVALLNELNIPLRAESVFALANCHSPGRPHVARALVQAGYCATADEAFERFLKRHRPAWVPKAKMSALFALDLVHNAGGLAIIAHPGLNRADEMIPPLIEAGMDGIECYHSRHSAARTEHYLKMAGDYGVLVTGGSDCHGHSKSKPLIGMIHLPFEHFERLKSAHAQISAASQIPPVPFPRSEFRVSR